jgi:uncharacterized protein YggU (UPF0235/DUF167 family)
VQEDDPIGTIRNGVFRLAVRPGRKKPGLARVDGALTLYVSAQAREGRANEEVRKVLASWLGIPVSSVTLVKGEGTRWKTLSVSGLNDEQIRTRLMAALGAIEARSPS